MSAILPVLSGDKIVKKLEKFGFVFVRQIGSHMILRREDPGLTVTVPRHKEVKKATLKSILRQTEISTEEFIGI